MTRSFVLKSASGLVVLLTVLALITKFASVPSPIGVRGGSIYGEIKGWVVVIPPLQSWKRRTVRKEYSAISSNNTLVSVSSIAPPTSSLTLPQTVGWSIEFIDNNPVDSSPALCLSSGPDCSSPMPDPSGVVYLSARRVKIILEERSGIYQKELHLHDVDSGCHDQPSSSDEGDCDKTVSLRITTTSSGTPTVNSYQCATLNSCSVDVGKQ